MTNKFILLVLSMALLFGACRTSKTGRTQGKMVVKADTVKDHQGELSIVYPGKIKAASDVNLAFRVAGPILRMPLEVGAFVKKGTVIAEIDPRDYEIQFSATEAEFRQVKGEAERVIELYNRKSVPVNDYEKAVYGLRQITAKYNAHRNALEDTRLLAPFDGYIQKKIFNPHETVNAGIPVISMINSAYFDVEIDIPSSDYVRQALFKSFSCTIDVFPDKVFPLELIEVTRKANLNQLYKMRLRLRPEKGFDIAAGMSVNVNIEYNPQISELTVIPLSAVFENRGDAAVWVYNPSTRTVSTREVKLGKILKDGTVIVAQGLKVGEIVISAGVHGLKEGMEVELLKGVSSTNVGGLL